MTTNIENNQSLNNQSLQVVVGLGQSGLSAVNYLLKQGYQVAVTDGNPSPGLASQLPDDVTIRKFAGIDESLLLQASRIVISPGIALEQPAIASAISAGVPVVSDIQLFHEALAEWKNPAKIVAITGSNAKSTVTTLVGEMAKNAGVNVGVGGNIGVPALTLLDDRAMELAVLELSSFQLETVTDLNAEVATVLNLSPDHLDRHGNMENYKRLKHKIFQGVKSIVTNRDDDNTVPNTKLVNSCNHVNSCNNIVSIGSDAPTAGNFGLITESDGQVYLAYADSKSMNSKLINTNELKIKGQHNQLNALHALALGKLAGLPMESMLATLQAFGGLPHRCQFVANVDGLDYFNDSKGTNIGSTMAAIKGLGESYTATEPNAKLALILGGQGKGQDFSEMTDLINQFVSHIYFIGEDGQLIENQLLAGGLLVDSGADGLTNIQCLQVETLEKAVEQ
ncbi:MAG: UDP-N-acetylmuramoyl-L-alanine--D-glutamate ligase, partial [Pseudomonadales bacterium]